MIDLKLPKEKLDKPVDVTSQEPYESPKYPYGMKIRMDGRLIKKAGCWDCEVGDELMVTGVAKVVEKSNEETEEKEPRKRMEFQFIKIDIGSPKDIKTKIREGVAKKVYEEKE